MIAEYLDAKSLIAKTVRIQKTRELSPDESEQYHFACGLVHAVDRLQENVFGQEAHAGLKFLDCTIEDIERGLAESSNGCMEMDMEQDDVTYLGYAAKALRFLDDVATGVSR